MSVRSLTAAPPVAHDVLANKTVVLFARRGIVAISYTGLAYLSGVPTDQWLAQTISGVDLSRAAAIAMGDSISLPFDVGQALEHLRIEAGRALMREPTPLQRETIEFQIVGSQWDRKHGRLRPVMSRITNARTGGAVFEKLDMPRLWNPWGSRYTVGSGTGVTEALGQLQDRFGEGPRDPEHCLKVMVDVIQQISRAYPGVVGSDCMCVHIQAATPRAKVIFNPEVRYQAKLGGMTTSQPIAFTPFVVSRNMVSMPSISANGLFSSQPGVDIVFQGLGNPRAETDGSAFLIHQERPPQPRSRGR